MPLCEWTTKNSSWPQHEVAGGHDLSQDWVPLLASHGWEVRYWATVGPGGAPDTDLMNWAREHQHVIVTQDLDFS